MLWAIRVQRNQVRARRTQTQTQTRTHCSPGNPLATALFSLLLFFEVFSMRFSALALTDFFFLFFASSASNKSFCNLIAQMFMTLARQFLMWRLTVLQSNSRGSRFANRDLVLCCLKKNKINATKTTTLLRPGKTGPRPTRWFGLW